MLCSSSSVLAAVVVQMFCPHLSPVKPCYNAHETKNVLSRTQEQKMAGVRRTELNFGNSIFTVNC